MPTDAERRSRDRATIQEADEDLARHAVVTCNTRLAEVEAVLAAQTQALALLTAHGETNTQRLSAINQAIWAASERKAELEWFRDEYEQRLDTLSATVKSETLARADNSPGTELAKRREAAIEKVNNPQRFTVLSTPEAALLFEVETRTIYRWKQDGRLRSGPRRGSITIKSVISLQKKRTKMRCPPK